MKIGISLFERVDYEYVESIVKSMDNGINLELSYDLFTGNEMQKLLHKLIKLSADFPALTFSMHGPMGKADISSRDKDLRKYSISQYEKAIKLSSLIGCRYIVLHTNSGHSIEKGKGGEMREIAYDSISNIIRTADSFEIEIGIENVGFLNNGSLLFDQYQFTDIFEEFKDSRVLLDIGHAAINMWDIPDLMTKLDDRIIAVHVHDNKGNEDCHNRINTGIIDWNSFFTSYKCMKVMPELTLEYTSLFSIGKQNLMKDICWIENKLR